MASCYDQKQFSDSEMHKKAYIVPPDLSAGFKGTASRQEMDGREGTGGRVM